jgi:hypothetical protein
MHWKYTQNKKLRGGGGANHALYALLAIRDRERGEKNKTNGNRKRNKKEKSEKNINVNIVKKQNGSINQTKPPHNQPHKQGVIDPRANKKKKIIKRCRRKLMVPCNKNTEGKKQSYQSASTPLFPASR